MEKKKRVVLRRYSSPCGMLLLGASDGRICLCDWMRYGSEAAGPDSIADRKRSAEQDSIADRERDDEQDVDADLLEMGVAQLEEYFAGERREFDLPLMVAGTEFQRMVWEQLREIPYGTTVSYGEVARRIGRPKSVRAVANAIGDNRLSIFLPCHRVIGADGSLTGYAGGLPAKEYLLKLEAMTEPERARDC